MSNPQFGLESIFEEDFLDFYGFLPRPGQHQALDTYVQALAALRYRLTGGRRPYMSRIAPAKSGNGPLKLPIHYAGKVQAKYGSLKSEAKADTK